MSTPEPPGTAFSPGGHSYSGNPLNRHKCSRREFAVPPGSGVPLTRQEQHDMRHDIDHTRPHNHTTPSGDPCHPEATNAAGPMGELRDNTL